MKSILNISFVLFSFSILFTSCRKDEETGNAPADSSIAKYLFDAVKDEVDQQINLQSSLNGFQSIESGPRGGCASVSIIPFNNTFPKTVTIVFPANCTTIAGALIEGTIVININGKVRESGTVASFKLENFKYKTYQLSGDYVVIFNGNNQHTTSISNGKVITPTNKTITYSALNTATQIEGTQTTFKTNPQSFLLDDVYSITTTSQGINSKGNNYSLTTIDPLIYKVICQWITKGKISIVEDSRPKITAVLDYGSGICDNKAILTINNFSTDITLP